MFSQFHGISEVFQAFNMFLWIKIKDKAKKIAHERFLDINDLLSDLDRLKEEINKRLEDWEKESV